MARNNRERQYFPASFNLSVEHVEKLRILSKKAGQTASEYLRQLINKL